MMSLKQFFIVLRARAWQIFAVFAIILALIIGVSVLMTPRYTASARILLDVKSPDPIAGSVLPAHLLNSYIATQVELVTSERVALRVVQSLRLQQDPSWVGLYRSRNPSTEDPIDTFVAKSLLRGLKVRPSKDSNILDISYSSTDRTSVAAIANAFVDAYIADTVEIRVDPARQTHRFFVEQAKQYRDQLEKAQARLGAFRSKHGITTSDERDDVDNMRLQQLSSQLTELQAARIDAARRRDAAAAALRTGTGGVSEVLNSPLVQNLKGELARAEARLSERSSVLGPNHPEIIRLRKEVESLRGRVAKEAADISTGLDRNFEIASQREAEVAAQLRRQRSLVLANKDARETLQVLQNDVDVAQHAYDSLAQKLTQSSLESQVTQANLTAISKAVTPTLPSSPNLPINVAIGVILGSMLGVIYALILETFRGRVRTEEDLHRSGGGPVIGILRPAPMERLPSTRVAALVERSEPELKKLQSSGDSGPVGPSNPWTDTREEATGDSALPAVVTDRSSDLADVLVEAGLISPREAQKILSIAEEKDIDFGEAAASSGLVTVDEINLALSARSNFPLFDPASSTVSSDVVAAFNASHPFMDDLRILRSQIKGSLSDGDPEVSRAVALVSECDGEGKTFTAANLAVSFAQMGERTLLIDGDMRHGSLHRLLGVSNEFGLSSLLGMRCRLKDAIQKVPGFRELSVIARGPDTPSPSDLIGRDSTKALFALLSRGFDVVIVDTPSAANLSDASLLAAASGNYVVVARQHTTLTSNVSGLVQKLSQLGARMLGTVLVKA